MPQFFIKNTCINENIVFVQDKDDLRHLKNVLRLKVNDEINFIDNEGYYYKTKINEITSEGIKAAILLKEKSNRMLKTDITLAQSIIKASGQDILIQKATEIGTNTIIPIITDHTVIKFDNQKDKNNKVARWQKIAQEACKQCERANMPVIEEISDLKQLFENRTYDLVIACVERNAQMTLKEFCQSHSLKHPKILVIVGPEGGWSTQEFELFNKYNIAQVSLGNLILRAETAAISVLSDLVYEYEL